MNEGLLDALKGVFIDIDKQQKHYQMELSFVKQAQLDLCTGDFLNTRNTSITVDQTTKCVKCEQQIELYPFTFDPTNEQIVHTHHLQN